MSAAPWGGNSRMSAAERRWGLLGLGPEAASPPGAAAAACGWYCKPVEELGGLLRQGHNGAARVTMEPGWLGSATPGGAPLRTSTWRTRISSTSWSRFGIK